ncbi:hypothetical protein BaOVIS_020410 [Babesia ovis]|uniref:Uncharacterized protein n=1 Tax=Babesia ovis TaxID=5869 RepID=A0A9W5TAS9_BABOV|nr:hypothetical protein BaOVIS_020410 [Babesia ovis]
MYGTQHFVPLQEQRADYRSVRRYNVDFCPIYSNPEPIAHDTGSNLKLYVVSRRNSIPGFQSYMPFDVFTRLNNWSDARDESPLPAEDIFDTGISSSEDEPSVYRDGRTSYIASPGSVSTRGVPSAGASPASHAYPQIHSVSREFAHSVARKEAASRVASPAARATSAGGNVVVVGSGPLDEAGAYSGNEQYIPAEQVVIPPQVVARSPGQRNVSFATAASPKHFGKRTISGRYDLERLSPTGYSPFASFGAAYSNGLQGQSEEDVSAAAASTIAKINNIRKRGRKPKALAAVATTGSTRGKLTVPPPPSEEPKKRGRKKKPWVKPGTVLAQMDTEELGLRIADASVLDTNEVVDPDITNDDIEAFPSFAGDALANYDGHQVWDGIGPVHRSDSILDRDNNSKRKPKARLSKAEMVLPTHLTESVVGTKGNKRSRVDHSLSDAGVQTHAIEPLRTSLAVGNDDFQMDEYGTLNDHVKQGRLGIGSNKKPRKPRSRNNINSAMLLNSWYISYVDDKPKKIPRRKDYEQIVEPIEERTRRYPTRSRLPPIQHWNSNINADGSSVLFLIGVTSDDEAMQAQHASGDLFIDDPESAANSPMAARLGQRSLPKASLVLTNSTGNMEIELIEPSDGPLAISNRPTNRHEGPIVDIASVDPTSAPKRGRPRKTAISQDEVDHQGAPKTKAAGRRGRPPGSHKPGVSKPQTKTVRKTGNKRNKEMTIGEALEILRTDSMEPLELEIQSPKSRRQSEFYQELSFDQVPAINNALENTDSVAIQNGKHISYKSFFRTDAVEAQMYNGSLFKPLIMNNRCRSSNVTIPAGRHVNMGNVKGNFICGYLYSGDNVCIRGLGTTWPIKERQTFFLPIFEEWAIYNDSE